MLVIVLATVLFTAGSPRHLAAAPYARIPRIAEPAIVGVDQESRFISVRNVPPGVRVDAYVGARFVGAAISRGGLTIVRLPDRLRPGTQVGVRTRDARGAGAFVVADVQADYVTYHFDNLRTGWNPNEITLTTADVRPGTFGPLVSVPVDGSVYTQPLVLSAFTMPDSTVHDVAYVATENDSVYAFDADSGAALWTRSLINPSAGWTAVPSYSVSSRNISPSIGVTATPVIDRAANTLFVVAASRRPNGASYQFLMRLHALALDTGLDQPGSPVDISAGAIMNDGSTFVFDPKWELSRAALLLNNGVVYIAFGSHGGNRPLVSTGWLIGYNEGTLAQVGAFDANRDIASVYLSTIWAAGFGPSADQFGDIYFATGDGALDADAGGNDFGMSVMKVAPNFTAAGFFMPYNAASYHDKDLSSAGVMLLPDQAGSVPHLAVFEGKTGVMYLLNRDQLGGYTQNGPDNTVQTIKHGPGKCCKGVHGGPAYYSGPTGQFVYYAGNQDALRAFALQTSPVTSLNLAGQSPDVFPGEGGSIPTVSSNGQVPGTAIVWVTTRPDNTTTTPVMLRAYDATNVTNELYAGSAGMWLNPNGNPYLTPTVFNGKVYVGSGNTVTIFGLSGSAKIRRPR